MKYYSTNKKAPLATLHEAVVKGLAGDRGLYMPERIKPLPKEFYENIDKMTFREIACTVAVDLNGGDVAPQCGELAFLDAAHFAFWVKHVHVYALYSEEPVCHSRSGVSAGGNEHMHLSAAVAAYEVLQQAGHETCTHIFEGKRRAVE